ncbi:DJ-1/PfpI family protein [Pseudonocardia dioxanivorans]|uniref:DJ-1/PfpI family protein n=1 Tax=Pseudonocardia dioxanivorans TaxID=240495 RepID=UPI000CD069D6|nr:DJ-1/PfpI family protein [Pseudonocardia dioxanivorans]
MSPRLLFLVSSAREIVLADGRAHVTGYFADEALTPYRRFADAGVEVVVATPDGRPPLADPYGLEPFFHYVDEDQDFLGTVVRSFHHDVDDIRVTLHHLTELDLAASRRIFLALTEAGLPADEARARVNRAAKIAWQRDRRLGPVLVEEGLAAPLDPERIGALVADTEAAARAEAADIAAALAELPDFRAPADLSAMTDAELAGFDAVFVPGGHGPMVDLADNPDVGRLLGILQEKHATVAALCHGPAALLAAGGRDDGQWLFEGYRLTCFTDEEEDQTRPGSVGMPWVVDTALKNCGAVLDDAPAAWTSHVVVDRNLVTGQNPMSADAVADAVLKSLEVL